MALAELPPTAFSHQIDQISFGAVHERYAKSPYGQKLEQDVRFRWFKAESVSNSDWEDLLGSDVNNLRHLNQSYGLARRFIMRNHNPGISDRGSVSPDALFTPKEQQLFLFTAIAHDWAEAEVGDIQFGTKSETDAESENMILRRIIGEMLPDVDPTESQLLGDQVVGILDDTSSKLGKAFHVVERLGYLRTGLTAWKKSQEMAGDEQHGLQLLTLNVTGRHVPHLLSYKETYPAVGSFFTSLAPRLEEVFETGNHIAMTDHPQNTQVVRDMFQFAHTVWRTHTP